MLLKPQEDWHSHHLARAWHVVGSINICWMSADCYFIDCPGGSGVTCGAETKAVSASGLRLTLLKMDSPAGKVVPNCSFIFSMGFHTVSQLATGLQISEEREFTFWEEFPILSTVLLSEITDNG